MIKLQTKSLLLRTVTHNDVEEVARMWKFEEGEISIEEAKKAIDKMEENHKKNCIHKIVYICFAVFELNCDKIIGWCGLGTGHPESMDKNRIEIFYLIDKSYRRKGYATECATKLLEYGFEKMQVDRIDGGCAKVNNRNIRFLINVITCIGIVFQYGFIVYYGSHFPHIGNSFFANFQQV